MAEEFEAGKFVEQREPGRVLESFELQGHEVNNIRYAKIEDFEGITEVDKARWKERSELKNVPPIKASVIETGELELEKGDLEKLHKNMPEKEKEIRSWYNEKLSQCEEGGIEFFKKGDENLWKALKEESFSDEKKPFFLVIEVDGKVVGYIQIGGYFNQPEDFEPKDAIRVQTISLLPEYQRRKIKEGKDQEVSIAHKLLELAVNEVKKESTSKDKSKLVLGTHIWTPQAVGFWVKEGFKRDKSVKEDDPYHLTMVKRLQVDK